MSKGIVRTRRTTKSERKIGGFSRRIKRKMVTNSDIMDLIPQKAKIIKVKKLRTI